MLVRLDPKTKAMTILSFPRDLVVDIPGHGRRPINHAFALGKERLALQTVNGAHRHQAELPRAGQLQGLRGHGRRLRPGSGSRSTAATTTRTSAPSGTDFDDINLQPGYQPLDGAKGLDFVRHRHSDSDIMRVGRQQAFISEFKKRLDIWTAAQATSSRLIGIAKDNVKILGAAKGGAPDIDTFQEYGSLLTEVGSNVVSVQLSVDEVLRLTRELGGGPPSGHRDPARDQRVPASPT